MIPPQKRLLVGMLKAFIEPDTVEEVVRANEQLAYAIEQAANARRWLKTLSPNQLSQRVKLPSGVAIEKVDYVIFGNGFAGSDYLPFDPEIPVVDMRFVLSPKFGGGSIFDAIAEYTSEVAKITNISGGTQQTVSIRLGGVTFEFPALLTE